MKLSLFLLLLSCSFFFSFEVNDSAQKQLLKISCHDWAVDMAIEDTPPHEYSNYDTWIDAALSAYNFYIENCSDDLVILDGTTLP